MSQPFHLHRPHYFARHLKLGLEELYVMVGLNDLAVSAILLFEPIFLYGLGYSLSRIALFYAVVYAAYLVLVPFGGQLAARLGYPRSILLASVASIAYYGMLFGTVGQPWLLWVAALCYALQKMLYWPAFEADFVRYADRDQAGRELSGIISLSTAVTIFGPLLGGLLVKFSGFPALFGVVIGLILLSNLPLFFSKNPATHETIGYRAAWRRLFDAQHRRALTACLGFAEELVVLVFWPIAMYQIVGSAAGLGGVVALATFVTAVVALYVGKLVDHHHQGALIRFGATASSVTWLARVAAVTPGFVMVVDTCSRVFKSTLYAPLLDIMFVRARRDGALKTMVFYEQALSIGKLGIALLLVGVFAWSEDLRLAFVLAAAASLLYRRLAPARS